MKAVSFYIDDANKLLSCVIRQCKGRTLNFLRGAAGLVISTKTSSPEKNAERNRESAYYYKGSDVKKFAT